MKFTDFKVMSFDIVGTLIDFETGILTAVRTLGGPKAAAASDEEIFEPYKRGRDKFYGRSSFAMKDVYLSLANECGFNADEATAHAFQLSVLRWPAFADSVEALRRLRKTYRLVAMTNADRTAFSAYSATLHNPFHDSVTCDETGCAKPDPRFFAFNRGRQSALGFQQSEILHVAQSQHHDIGVAKAEGYTVCWIERRQGLEGFGGTPDPTVLTRPDYHFASLKQLADAVDAERADDRVAA
ncbi:HAD-IA family hydrolase [Ancylobacter dichloromethanicus]|uniref:2-haloalkanoic acid dehalogenase n=1 Tax=Ancylobacter dichloromethanicus TaxID=518825 RepID=A0A9W6J9H4_9HYPH|nr:HAD-IA family hydrolase [Ancylobacter dichloromethanicus]MBS7554403.1 HAD-IA family hydrolase [Ancylobacter dichloromethanicus]GLK71528.1 2-haloalkanoic acid dehalogenase [Ancylobacter dichloromethanicus]